MHAGAANPAPGRFRVIEHFARSSSDARADEISRLGFRVTLASMLDP